MIRLNPDNVGNFVGISIALALAYGSSSAPRAAGKEINDHTNVFPPRVCGIEAIVVSSKYVEGSAVLRLNFDAIGCTPLLENVAGRDRIPIAELRGKYAGLIISPPDILGANPGLKMDEENFIVGNLTGLVIPFKTLPQVLADCSDTPESVDGQRCDVQPRIQATVKGDGDVGFIITGDQRAKVRNIIVRRNPKPISPTNLPQF